MLNTYGGQFQGFSGGARAPSPSASPRQKCAATKAEAKPDEKADAKGADAANAAGGANSGSALNAAPAATATLGSQSSGPPAEKLVLTIKKLSDAVMAPLVEGETREFVVVALFENDDLNKVIHQTRNRTRPFGCENQGSKFSCNFKSCEIILPVTDPKQRALLYLCAISNKPGVRDGRAFRDISLLGTGFTQPLIMSNCVDVPTHSFTLRLVDGGDASMTPGVLELGYKACLASQGPPIPEDKESNIMSQFQVIS